ncbi:MAG: ATP synthase subunit I [Proteobacteria bacterium]|nr:ATP synthase subunit I [Pseudomonadota bacterium]MDP2104345.1 ATP synthase subunit I [Desulfobulbaceae bacterium]
MDRQPDFSLNTVLVCNWALLAAMPLAAAMAYSGRIAVAVLIGAVIANASFILLKKDLTQVMKGPMQAVKVRFFIKYYMRLSVLAVMLYFLVRYGQVHVVGLLVGLSSVVVGIVVAAVSQAKDIYFSGKEAL